MQVVDARLKCGCVGIERIDHDSIGIRFNTHEPCAQHEEWRWRWRHLSETDRDWRDEKQVTRYARDNALFDEWKQNQNAAIAANHEPETFRDFIFRRYAENPDWLKDD